MNNIRLLRQDTLDLLRFPLAVIVVIAHTFNSEDVVAMGITYRVSECKLFQDASVFIDAFLRGISVPIYFFISGYVFFVGVKFCRDIYIKKIKNRIKTLFIPYIIWNAIALLFIILKSLPIFETFLSNSNSTLNLTTYTIFECFWKYNGNINPHFSIEDGQMLRGSYFPVNAALWYLRDLMIIVLSTPLLYCLVKKFKGISPFLFLVIYIVSLFFNWSISMIAGGYFFFSWGAYMSIFNIDMMTSFNKWFKISILMYLFNCAIYIMLRNTIVSDMIGWIKTFNSIFALLACFNIAAWILQNTSLKVSSFLASSSFFIYVSHCIVYGRLRKLLFIIFKPNSDIEILCCYIATVLFTVLLLLLIYYLLKKYCPSFLKIVVGRK